MIKDLLQFIVFIGALFSIHTWVVLPMLDLESAVPVIYQHLLLGGFSLLIYFVTNFIAEHFNNYTGFVVLGFLLVKMIFISIFLFAYEKEFHEQQILKYVLLAFYFTYLIFLIVKIIPVINILPQDSEKES